MRIARTLKYRAFTINPQDEIWLLCDTAIAYLFIGQFAIFLWLLAVSCQGETLLVQLHPFAWEKVRRTDCGDKCYQPRCKMNQSSQLGSSSSCESRKIGTQGSSATRRRRFSPLFLPCYGAARSTLTKKKKDFNYERWVSNGPDRHFVNGQPHECVTLQQLKTYCRHLGCEMKDLGIEDSSCRKFRRTYLENPHKRNRIR
jgi:hypothetical protein